MGILEPENKLILYNLPALKATIFVGITQQSTKFTTL